MRIDRLLLATYLVALFGLLMFPIQGTQTQLLGIGSDKWVHIALFGGLAVMLRWNLSGKQRPVMVSMGIAFAVAAATEVGQVLVVERSGEWLDLLAGLIGATIGAASADIIILSPVLQKLLGLIVVALGLMIATFFLLADIIGVGDSIQFGRIQVAGIIIGAIIAVGGFRVYLAIERSNF